MTIDRLRLIDGVSEVTLQSSTKATPNGSGASSSGSGNGTGACEVAFNMQITFDALPTIPASGLDRLGDDRLRLDEQRDVNPLNGSGPMTGRDRIVVVGLAALAVLAAVWLLAVAPEREKAATLATEVSTAQTQLTSAESQVHSAAAAQAQYQTDYASIVSLGKAVPADQEVPSLIYQLSQATNEKNVEFASITSGGAGGSSRAARFESERRHGGRLLRERVRHGGERRLHADAVHVYVQRQLQQPL